MEVAHNLHFEFKSPPHDSAPSTPKRFGEYYFSAPTSPSHLSHFYRDFDDLFDGQSGGGSAVVSGSSAATVPFQWEEKPGTPKSPSFKFKNDEFAFDVSDDWETASLPADELFDGGVIKPLKPPPRKNPASISLSLLSQRGRERGLNPSKSSSRRAARSLSPLRDTQYTWEEEKEQPPAPTNPNNTGCSALSASVKVQKKWRFKDFFLFRSASEGRAADKDPLKKYTAAFRHYSFRAIDSPGSGSGSRRRGPVSPHELHYTVNRAVSEDLKRKTFLPYKQGILGRLAFNPAVHALANGFGLSRK